MQFLQKPLYQFVCDNCIIVLLMYVKMLFGDNNDGK